MKKAIVLVAGILLVGSVNAQNWMGGKRIKGNGKVVTINRTTSDYESVSVAGFFDVELVKGTEGKITLKGEENLLEYIETQVKDGNLKIKSKKGYNINTSRNHTILVTVPFEDISAVSLSGSGDVVSKNLITADDFKARLSGSGDLSLEIKADNVEAGISGSGDLKLQGNTRSFDVAISGSGDVHAFDLQARHVEASVSGSGDIRVHCSESLKARVVGSGDVTYRGNPDKKDTKVVGSGDISGG